MGVRQRVLTKNLPGLAEQKSWKGKKQLPEESSGQKATKATNDTDPVWPKTVCNHVDEFFFRETDVKSVSVREYQLLKILQIEWIEWILAKVDLVCIEQM